MHRTGWFALARIGSTIVAFCAVTLIVFVAFYAVPSRSSFPRRGPSHRLTDSTSHAYLRYLWALARHGDLGHSFYFREAVTTRILRAAPVTLSLLVGGLAIALLFAVVPLLRPPRAVDRGTSLFAFAGISIHPVWFSLVLSWLFGSHWHLLAEQGYCGITSAATGCDGLTHWASHLLLPWIVLGLVSGAYYSLAVRSLLAAQLQENYVVEARAKGLGERRIVRRHVLRNMAGDLMTLFVTNLGVTFSAVVFVETIFGLPGLGNMFRRSLLQHDLPVTAGIVMAATLTILAISLVAELASLAVQPRPTRRAKGMRALLARPSGRTSSSIAPASAPPVPPAPAP